ncbi:MFS transporter [Kribbella sp. NBC_01484]|nr:MFS transporter [Kribbella sp. NBC_01484]
MVSLAAAFAASSAPIPLFNLYRAEEGFSNADISLTVVAYDLPTLAALLVMGRLSNHVGRRSTAIASLGLLALGCLLLLNVHDIGTLLAGRVLMSLGAGLASSNVTAYVVDAVPSRPAWLASVASSQTVTLGLAVGAIASGTLVQYGPSPRHLTYLVAVGSLFVSAVLIVVSPETVTRTPGAWRPLRPSVRVPSRVRGLLPVAAAVFLSTWATGAFYQAFVPGLVEDQLHSRSSFVLRPPAHRGSRRVISTRAWRARWSGRYSTRSAFVRARSRRSVPSWPTTSREPRRTPICSTPGTRATPIARLPRRLNGRPVDEFSTKRRAVGKSRSGR